ncbi:MAG TPA: lysylphosphatidylglycerol synthase domain-containing protein [Miltoncostaeaceae bacterium]|nr:lysylphosphatidylglycerol synthase domain-containing protein [Miltoncostaeaceae bacterium]
MTGAAAPGETTDRLGPRRGRPRDLIARGLLTLALVGLVLWLLLSNVGELSEVVEALKQVSVVDAILLVALLLVSQVLIGAQLAATVPGLGLARGMVAVESASAASNVIPGPSGTATRLAVLRSWGFYTDDFARSWLFTSSLTNFTVLAMPAIAVVLVAIDNDVPGGVFALAAVALVACAIAVYVVVRVVRSERFARRAGALTGRMARWGAGVARRRPTDRDFEEATLRFRDDLRTSWRTLGTKVTLAVVGTYVTTGVIFALSLRATGLGRDALAIGAIAVVYTVVRLLTIVNFTPGGVGVTEALYTSALLTATGGDYQSQIVAGVFLFRGLTYAGPIILGAVALLVWRFRRSWRVRPPAEPVGAAAVGAVLADREPPR